MKKTLLLVVVILATFTVNAQTLTIKGIGQDKVSYQTYYETSSGHMIPGFIQNADGKLLFMIRTPKKFDKIRVGKRTIKAKSEDGILKTDLDYIETLTSIAEYFYPQEIRIYLFGAAHCVLEDGAFYACHGDYLNEKNFGLRIDHPTRVYKEGKAKISFGDKEIPATVKSIKKDGRVIAQEWRTTESKEKMMKVIDEALNK